MADFKVKSNRLEKKWQPTILIYKIFETVFETN